MKQRLITLIVSVLLPYGVHGSERLDALPVSGEDRSAFGPTAAIGIDKNTLRITGFYHFKQAQMPDHSFHANCKIFFTGKFDRQSPIPVAATDASENGQKAVKGTLEFRGRTGSPSSQLADQIFSLRLSGNFPGCSRAVDLADVDFDFIVNSGGDWNSLTVVRAKRAYFYSRDNHSTKEKSYVVRGDLLYIYSEKPDWLYVKFAAGNKERKAWVRRSDTLTPLN